MKCKGFVEPQFLKSVRTSELDYVPVSGQHEDDVEEKHRYPNRSGVSEVA
ncbi:hypothetical protein [Paenibacillus alba]|uniref:Uncharacterized protein n=1 Tax=Paenibacillus alba TaxID=1197127 RepID=A0ABU6G4J4_9BACL|nr:hypothetical protein [Paenibacillus alba]MEC0228192.1 hypothetical protein [Paenibacillus alba]